MSLTVKALTALLGEADPDALVVVARFDGDEVHADSHIDDKGQVVLREQGREFALKNLAEAAADSVLELQKQFAKAESEDVAVAIAGLHEELHHDQVRPHLQALQAPLTRNQLRDHIHSVVAGGVEPVKPIADTRVGEFADE